MTLKELEQARANGAELDAMVVATDAVVYLLQVVRHGDGESTLPVTLQDARGNNLVYKSRYAADQAFARAGLTRVTLVHESAYGEMIGTETGCNRMEHSYPVKTDSEST